MSTRRQFVAGGLGLGLSAVLAPIRSPFALAVTRSAATGPPIPELELLPSPLWLDGESLWAVGRPASGVETLYRLSLKDGIVAATESVLEVRVSDLAKVTMAAVSSGAFVLGGTSWTQDVRGYFEAGEVSDKNYPSELVSPPIPRKGGGLLPRLVEHPLPWLAISPFDKPSLATTVVGLPPNGMLVRILEYAGALRCWTFSMDDELGDGLLLESTVDVASSAVTETTVLLAGLGEGFYAPPGC